MRVPLRDPPHTIVTILDSQYRPLNFTVARAKLLSEVQVKMPELALVCSVQGKIVHIQLESLDLDSPRALVVFNG